MADVVTTCPKCKAQYHWNSSYQDYPDCPHCGYNAVQADREKRSDCRLEARQGNFEGVKKHLNDPDVKKNINAGPVTILHEAVKGKNSDIVRYLLKNGSNPDTTYPGIDSETPLHFAAREGVYEIAKILIESGASVNKTNSHGKTPLDYAREKNNDAIIKLFEKAEFNSANSSKLIAAVREGDIDTLKELAGRGADLNWRDERSGQTPLHAAVYNNKLDVIRYLVDEQVDLNAVDDEGITPIVAAAKRDNVVIAKLLNEHGIPLDIKDDKGVTPLEVACNAGNITFVKYLIEQGLDLKVKNNRGFTPLYYACMERKEEIAKLLIDNNVLVDANRKDLDAILFAAAWGGLAEIVKLLLELGANPKVKVNGMSPLEAAEGNWRDAVVELLKSQKNKPWWRFW